MINQHNIEPVQSIYFDDDDDVADGHGWNVVDNLGSVAARFATLDEATLWCRTARFPFVILNGGHV